MAWAGAWAQARARARAEALVELSEANLYTTLGDKRMVELHTKNDGHKLRLITTGGGFTFEKPRGFRLSFLKAPTHAAQTNNQERVEEWYRHKNKREKRNASMLYIEGHSRIIKMNITICIGNAIFVRSPIRVVSVEQKKQGSWLKLKQCETM